MKTWVKWLCCICIVGCLGFLLPTEVAADDTVYVRKNVSLLYDNSGSMRSDLGHLPNLKWCYASYAAQAFTGLLNETDTLTVTFMNNNTASQIEADLSGDRQNAVSNILQHTTHVEGGTLLDSIDTALDVLEAQGLMSNGQSSGSEDSSEQYWLVLTTDGVFDDGHTNYTPEEVETFLEGILTEFPSLNLVYFGIGTEGDNSEFKATDYRPSVLLNAHPNFTAVYAENAASIVSVMQELSNQIAGRYTVTENVSVNGTTVTLEISGESSPIRNIAVLAQNSQAQLIGATAADGSALKISRNASLDYPTNNSYDNVPSGTKGGTTALITAGNDEKIPAGTVTLTFSEAVDPSSLTLMYEPAIYIDLQVQRKNATGDWVDLGSLDDLFVNDEVRVNYTICEDGTGKVLDAKKLFGETKEEITYGAQSLTVGESFVAQEGSSVLSIDLQLMDGAYCISTNRTLNAVLPRATDYTVTSSGPVSLEQQDAATNTDAYAEFTVMWDGAPISAEQMANFKLEVTGANGDMLDGSISMPEVNVVRFIPQDADCQVGDYTLTLSHSGTVVSSETISITPNQITYSAVAGSAISIMSNETASNAQSLSFAVTAHQAEESRPITAQEADLFRVTAESADGETLDGLTAYAADGTIIFTPQDSNASVGEYTVTLWLEAEPLAETLVAILQYNAVFTVDAFVSDDNTVDRLNLRKNKNHVSFIVYADGVPCSAGQLEAMLTSQISITTDPNSRYLGMDYSFGQHDGKPALLCTPTCPVGPIRGFFHRILIAYRGLPLGDLDITLTVNTPNGSAGTATMQIVNHPALQIFYFLLPWITLLILIAIGIIILSNGLAHRMRKGTLYHFQLQWSSVSRNRQGYVILGTPDRCRTGDDWKIRIFPWTESRKLSEVTFVAKKLNKRHWWSRTVPEFVRPANTNIKYVAGSPTKSDPKAVLLRELEEHFEQTSRFKKSADAVSVLADASSIEISGSSHALNENYSYISVVSPNPNNNGMPSYEIWFFVKRGARKKKAAKALWPGRGKRRSSNKVPSKKSSPLQRNPRRARRR